MTLSVETRTRAADATAVPFTSRLRRRVQSTWQDLTRDRVLGAVIAAELEFEHGERVLAADGDCGGDYAVVATNRALYHRVDFDGARADSWTRLGWEQIARVGWDAAAGQLIITGPADAAAPRIVVPLRHRGTVPELALERVTHTRLGQWQLLVGGTRHAVIEARRRPGTGELLWSVTYASGGRGPTDPGLRARVERAIARLSAEFGALPQQGTGPSAVQAAIGRPRSGGTAAEAG